MSTTRKRCWFLHDWTQWADTKRGKITSFGVVSGQAREIGSFIDQERRRVRCGKVQLRQEAATL